MLKYKSNFILESSKQKLILDSFRTEENRVSSKIHSKENSLPKIQLDCGQKMDDSHKYIIHAARKKAFASAFAKSSYT